MSTARAKWIWRGVGVLVVLGAIVFVIEGANRPADPSLEPATATSAPSTPTTTATPPASAGRIPVPGFAEIAYRVNRMNTVQRCALLADTPARRGQGLMNRRDLAGHDGMLFVFETVANNSFYMKDTLIPLSIAWFDNNGRFVSSTDMEPCPTQVQQCPLYSATAPYRYALEVAKGGLGSLGIGPGSALTVGGVCA